PDRAGDVAMRSRVHREIENEGEQEIGCRAGERDRRLLPRRLLEKPAPAILRRKLLEGIVARELDVSAQRQERDAVLRLAPLHAEEARTEADREPQRLHTKPLADEEMPELVEEDDDADEDRERDQRQAGRVQVRDHSAQCNVYGRDFQQSSTSSREG